MKLISIIMPVYNPDDMFVKAVEAVLKQDYKDIELLIIDDGSSQKPENILKNNNISDKRIIFLNEEHKGQAAARNRGLDIAKGEYVFFADADDIMEKSACAVMIEKIEKYKADILITGYRQINKSSSKDVTSDEGIFSGSDIRKDYTEYTSLSKCKVLGSCWNKLFVMKIIKEHNIRFPENFLRNEEEIFLMNYLTYAENIVQISEIIYNFYSIDMKKAVACIPEDFCFEVLEFARERIKYAKMWGCDNKKTRQFISAEYWGKMMLGLKLSIIKGYGYKEFKNRCNIILNGLDEIEEVSSKVSGSRIYKVINKKMFFLAWFLVKRMCK